jgi:hypothetical protein
METKLETGSYYWQRHPLENIWRVGYVGEDPDGEQWWHLVGTDAIPLAQMNLEGFDWVLIRKPGLGDWS